jgi:hypothetical protein
MKLSSEDAAVILRDAAAKIESGQYDAGALLQFWLPPVHHFLHEQTLPACTCPRRPRHGRMHAITCPRRPAKVSKSLIQPPLKEPEYMERTR